MAHTIKEKAKLLSRARRIRGQIEALERALDEERGCAVVMQQIAAARGAINGLMAEVIEDHLREHVLSASIVSDVERTEGAEELLAVIRAYLK